MNGLFNSLIILMLTSCAAMPQFMDDVEKMETDTAVKIEVDKEALQQNTNLNIKIDVTNTPTPTK